MYKIYITRNTDADYIYYRDTYKEAIQLANSQRKQYVDQIEIIDTNNDEIIYCKQINDDRTGWIITICNKDIT